MKITVAGVVKDYPAGTTVEELLAAEQVEMPQYATVTINDDFVETADRTFRQIQEGGRCGVPLLHGRGC